MCVAAAGALGRAGPSRPATTPGHAGVERVDRLARLEVDVRVLRGAADERPLRRQRPRRGARGPAPRAPARAGRRRRAARSCSARARCGTRRRSARTAPASRASRPARPAPGRGPPAPTPTASSAKPVWRTAITSEWSPKIDSPCAASDRAATCITAEVSSPAILYMFGIISSRPCEAVNVVASAPPCSAPCSAPAAPPSLCISTTVGHGAPHVRPAPGSTTRRPARPSARTA